MRLCMGQGRGEGRVLSARGGGGASPSPRSYVGTRRRRAWDLGRTGPCLNLRIPGMPLWSVAAQDAPGRSERYVWAGQAVMAFGGWPFWASWGVLIEVLDLEAVAVAAGAQKLRGFLG